MHRSRLAGFIIDCQVTELDPAAEFWARALGMPSKGHDGDAYVRLDDGPRDQHIEVQRVTHESRVHLDIETDDIEAEVARLEALGARRVDRVSTWSVMQAPTGQHFCVVRAPNLDGAAGVNTWK